MVISTQERQILRSCYTPVNVFLDAAVERDVVVKLICAAKRFQLSFEFLTADVDKIFSTYNSSLASANCSGVGFTGAPRAYIVNAIYEDTVTIKAIFNSSELHNLFQAARTCAISTSSKTAVIFVFDSFYENRGLQFQILYRTVTKIQNEGKTSTNNYNQL